MTCTECLAELVNRHIALYGAVKRGDKERQLAECGKLDAHIARMLLCERNRDAQ
jgi:hypothetical protein